jgi:hypothetical protein
VEHIYKGNDKNYPTILILCSQRMEEGGMESSSIRERQKLPNNPYTLPGRGCRKLPNNPYTLPGRGCRKLPNNPYTLMEGDAENYLQSFPKTWRLASRHSASD